MFKRFCCAIFVFGLLFLLSARSAWADSSIQMLPPTLQGSSDSSISPCANMVKGSPTILAWDGQNPINCVTGFYADPNGHIGIGTSTPQSALDVEGEVRIGNSGTTCTAANEGAVRYDTAIHRLEYCNDSAWSLVGNFGNMITFLTPGATQWTVPANVTSIEIEAWGGGGGASGGQGGTGGGGGYATGIYSVTPGTTYSVVVGAGGRAAMYPNLGGNGGTSSVLPFLSANGGSGGNAGGGLGGAASGGQLNIAGGDGMDLGGNGEGNTLGGVPGGSAPRGGPGGGVLGSAAAGQDGHQPGGGGGGTLIGGGNGAAGGVMIRY